MAVSSAMAKPGAALKSLCCDYHCPQSPPPAHFGVLDSVRFISNSKHHLLLRRVGVGGGGGGEPQLIPMNLSPPPKRSRNASPFLPAVVRAHTSPGPDYIPDAKFYKIEAILRPWRIPQVSSALLKMGIRGVTVSDVRGFGAQGGLTERQAGSEFSEDKFLAKVKMEIVVSKDQVEDVIDKIIEEARTGEIGDGKIFLVPIADVVRVRTGERGEKAERMVGGRYDMSSPV